MSEVKSNPNSLKDSTMIETSDVRAVLEYREPDPSGVFTDYTVKFYMTDVDEMRAAHPAYMDMIEASERWQAENLDDDLKDFLVDRARQAIANVYNTCPGWLPYAMIVEQNESHTDANRTGPPRHAAVGFHFGLTWLDFDNPYPSMNNAELIDASSSIDAMLEELDNDTPNEDGIASKTALLVATLPEKSTDRVMRLCKELGTTPELFMMDAVEAALKAGEAELSE